MPEPSSPARPSTSTTPSPRSPSHARKSFFSLAVVLLGFTVFTPTMLAGAALGDAFSLGDLVLVILAGSLILGSYVALLGWIGARTGLTTVVMSRYSLGSRGPMLASLLLGGTQIGWYGVIVGTIGELTAQALVGVVRRPAAVMIVTSVLMCATACYGYRGCTGCRRLDAADPDPRRLGASPLAGRGGRLVRPGRYRPDVLDAAGRGDHDRGRHLRVGRHAGAELDQVRPHRRPGGGRLRRSAS